jgi:hypothetical protein
VSGDAGEPDRTVIHHTLLSDFLAMDVQVQAAENARPSTDAAATREGRARAADYILIPEYQKFILQDGRLRSKVSIRCIHVESGRIIWSRYIETLPYDHSDQKRELKSSTEYLIWKIKSARLLKRQ